MLFHVNTDYAVILCFSEMNILKKTIDFFLSTSSKKKSLKILITNITLAHFSGTETAVRDLALGLSKLGHVVAVFTNTMGGVSEMIQSDGIPIVTNLKDLSFKPDIIHGHHTTETLKAIHYFNNIPAIFICHDHLSWHDIPPIHPAIYKYFAVDQYCFNRLHFCYQIPNEHIGFLYNSVDVDKFNIRQVIPQTPKKALIFSSHYIQQNSNFVKIIEQACISLNIKLDILEASNNQSPTPEKIIAQYDIIFAKGRCALEALACRCAVISIGTKGLGEMVTPDNVADLRNFSFIKHSEKHPICVEAVIAEIKKYDSTKIQIVCEYIRKEASLKNSLTKILNIYVKAIKEHQLQTGNYDWDYSQVLNLQFAKLEQQEMSSLYCLPSANDIGKDLSLKIIQCQEKIQKNSVLEVELKIINASKDNLSMGYPCPVSLAYYFRDPKLNSIDKNYICVSQSLEVRPNTILDCCVAVKIPDIIGNIDIFFTFIQESVAAFDLLPIPVLVRKSLQIIE